MFYRYIPISTKSHTETNVKVEVWEQLLNGEVGEKTVDNLILSVSYAV